VALPALALAVIEITGWPGIVLLLVPVVALAIVIIRSHRAKSPARTPQQATEMLRATPPVEIGSPEVAMPAAAGLAERVRAAEAAKDQQQLAGLYLELAREEIAQGRTDAAREHLKSSVGCAARSRNRAVQAEARLELADLAREAGDLTTACEHWQIARSLFRELGQDAGLAETERVMQKHGCPTDWVLNDF
jgi:tetratricopeptide (TPR) repeat protein